MRHRGQFNEDDVSAGTIEMLATLTDLRAARQAQPGKHRAPVTPQIPEQNQPTHDTDPESFAPAPVARPAAQAAAVEIPATAQWRASHFPRAIATVLFLLAVLGTSGLGVRYSQSRNTDNFVSLVIGLVVVVILWALMIASTPQVVSLDGSILTVRNTGGSESFNLADGLQPIDLVGDPRTSHWAVLLHRHNNPTVVLRRNDVAAAELDPIVRHYRNAATQRLREREARFNR